MKEIIATLLPLLAQVESNNDPNAIGDNGAAWGMYQIHRNYWYDGCIELNEDVPYSEAFIPKVAEKIVTGYLIRYGRLYKKSTGKEPTLEVLARIHNGGPFGWSPKARTYANTTKYWQKIKKAQTEMKGNK